ncbi:hypothetical protein GCM10009865_44250 [Aeromicrobium ponti]
MSCGKRESKGDPAGVYAEERRTARGKLGSLEWKSAGKFKQRLLKI